MKIVDQIMGRLGVEGDQRGEFARLEEALGAMDAVAAESLCSLLGAMGAPPDIPVTEVGSPAGLAQELASAAGWGVSRRMLAPVTEVDGTKITLTTRDGWRLVFGVIFRGGTKSP